VIHRHLDYPEDVPVEQRGLMALDDILDRGDLETWRPLIKAIAADPWGRIAVDVLHLCDAHPMYGTSNLWRAYVATRRAAALAPAQDPTITLSALRAEAGLSQAELGRRLGMNQSEVSKLERRDDVRLSTLRAVVAALGGRLRPIVSFLGRPDRELVPLNAIVALKDAELSSNASAESPHSC
jgi:DNA-binding Xre family transcriptional regulator